MNIIQPAKNPLLLAALLTCLGAYLSLAQSAPEAITSATELVSVASDGTQGNDHSEIPAISADGNIIAFTSAADNLVPNDNNFRNDIFVHDRVTGQTTLVSVSSSGVLGNENSLNPVISADGRYVAFESYASNLVPGDIPFTADIFLHDRVTGQTVLITVAQTGGRANSDSFTPAISADGQSVAFESAATNLVPNDTNGPVADIFVRDWQAGQTTLVARSTAGVQANSYSFNPTLSGDGRFVAFDSLATNLVTGDTNGESDVFVHDRTTGQTTLVSVSSRGGPGNNGSWDPSISDNGRFISYQSLASNLVNGDRNSTYDIFLFERNINRNRLISVSSSGVQGNFYSSEPDISGDGLHVAFVSYATNLVPGDTNGWEEVFVRDWRIGQTVRASIASDGSQPDLPTTKPVISADGQVVAFNSEARNLVPGDTNNFYDVFIHDRASPSLLNRP